MTILIELLESFETKLSPNEALNKWNQDVWSKEAAAIVKGAN